MSERQTGKGIVRNVAYGSLAWLLPLALGFIATPLILSALGIADYGIYVLVVGFIGYSFTFAIGRAITKYVAEYRSTEDRDKIGGIVSATLFLNAGVGLIGVAAILTLADWIVGDLLRIEETLRAKSVHALYIATLIIFFTMLGQAFSAVLQGLHRFDVYSKILNVGSLLLVLGNLILAGLGFGINGLLLWGLASTFATTAAFLVAARRLLPEFALSFKIGRPSWDLVLRHSTGVVGYQLLANLILLFERGWMTRQFGPETVTYYVVPMMFGIYVHGFVTSLMLVIFPLASELQHDIARLESLYLKATKIVCGIVVFMVATLIVVREELLTVYLGPDFAIKSSDLLILHALSFGCAAILTVSWQMTEGLGRPGFNARIISLCAIISLPLMVILSPSLESIGFAIARLAGFGTIFFSIFLVERTVFGSIRWGFWLRTTSLLGAAGVAATIVETLLIRSFSPSWFAIILAMTVGFVVYISMLLVAGFVTEDERALARSILTRRNA